MITAILVLLASAFGAVFCVYLAHTTFGPALTNTDYGMLFVGGVLFGIFITPCVLAYLAVRSIGGVVHKTVERLEVSWTKQR